ncbi:MAG: flagellar export protein FliJ [Gammaproteobacteria bacterium]
MKQGNRLDKLVELNQGFENLAVAPLIEARTAFQKQEDQLKQLLDYRDEYQRQLEEKLTGSTSASSLRDFQYFFSSLSSAIEQQTAEVERAAAALEVVERQWLMRRQETRKLEKAAGNINAKIAAAANRAEQKELDEISCNRYARKVC